MHPSARPYADRRIALLTQHGKERVIAPALEPGLGCTIEHVSGFDTDLLGTFTRETARAGSQLDAARRKARKGMELSGLDAGLAAVGSGNHVAVTFQRVLQRFDEQRVVVDEQDA